MSIYIYRHTHTHIYIYVCIYIIYICIYICIYTHTHAHLCRRADHPLGQPVHVQPLLLVLTDREAGALRLEQVRDDFVVDLRGRKEASLHSFLSLFRSLWWPREKGVVA